MLGFAAGLPADSFRPFAYSLRATGYKGRFGLITTSCTPQQRQKLAELADLHWDVDGEFQSGSASPASLRTLRWLRRTRGARRLYPAVFQAVARGGPERKMQARWESLEYEMEGLQALRYKLYYDFIREHAPDADVVLLSDLRDVVFQADPFDPPVHGLELFLEDSSSRLGVEPFNRRWLHNLYGPERLAALAQRPTSCSGTTVGDKEAILDYLTAMWQAIQWRRRPLGSHDQGVHNELINLHRFPAARVVSNATGRVLTMGLMTGIRINEDGLVLNDDGTVPSVLHQYDRHPQLAAQLWASLAPSGDRA